MLTVQRSRTIAASPEDLWEVLGDPHHLPRWWPRVSRVEAVTLTGTGEQDAFTEVLAGPSGKIVRADFKLLEQVDRQRIVWSQQVDDTPFARVLRSAETEITLADASEGSTAGSVVSQRHVAGSRISRGHVADSLDGGHDEPLPATEVTIELRQELQGFSPRPGSGSWIGGLSRFGSPLVRRAARSTIDEALDGLERIMGGTAA
ncbi:MAG TPA: SRPBCC family protein [Solirubrobacteraceae bacterium]|jgi:uncharacterized protein YndB with AHSA1/START domain|nr:SRPBCC family protein [Solirubrobacteraceae bacterium]